MIILERITINKLRKIYDNLISKSPRPKYYHYLKYNYLNLSIQFSRDEREFDIDNYKLLKNLNYQVKETFNIFSKKHNFISGYKKYLLSFKEQNYIPNKNLPILFILDILKHLNQIFDIVGIALIISFSAIITSLKKSNKEEIKLDNKKIYSIYYWKGKSSNSSIYYYPSINSSKSNKAFISSFADSRYFSKGLIHSLFNSNFLSPAKILNIKDLILSILQFIHLFIYDIYLVIFKKDFHFLSIWIGWKKGAEIFYSILIYNSMIKLVKRSSRCEFISWHENQITNRSFSLGVSFARKIYFSSCSLSTFNGTLFTKQAKRQFLPLKSELLIGFWGEKYYLQDEGSMKEMKSFLKEENLDISLKVSPKSMLRVREFPSDIKSNSNKLRDITIFSHASYWDLIGCLLSIFNHKNKSISYQRRLIVKHEKLYIRLHPSLNKEDALSEIKRIKEIPHYINYEFIGLSEESLITSIKSSKNCLFGISSYVNIAIKLGSKVFAVETSHIYKSPIKFELINSPNLTKLSPW